MSYEYGLKCRVDGVGMEDLCDGALAFVHRAVSGRAQALHDLSVFWSQPRTL